MHQLPTVLLGTANHVYRTGFAACMQQGNNYQLVNHTNSYTHLLQLAKLHQPQVIITSLHPAEGSMAEACLQLPQTDSPPAIIILSVQIRRLQFEECVKAGALGFMELNDDSDCSQAAIESVIAGRMYYSKAQAEFIRCLTHGKALLDITTPKERQIIRYWAAGLTCAEIGHQMHLSEETIMKCRKTIIEKLRIKSSEVIGFAFQNGIAQWEEQRVTAPSRA